MNKKFLIIIAALSGAVPAFAQMVNIKGGTTVMASAGVQVTQKAGTFANNGTYTDTTGIFTTLGGVAFSGAGNTNLHDFNINNGGSTTSSSGNVMVNNTLNMLAGTLNANGGVTLVSTAERTARIPAIAGGTITGNVNVQQYVQGGARSYRFFGHPFSTAIPLSNITGVDITGQGGNANGFTSTVTNNPSAYWYDPTTGNGSVVNDPGWTPFTSAYGGGANDWKQYEGIRILVRGTPGQGLDGNPYTPAPTTISFSGPVNQGSLNEPFIVGTNSPYNVLSNPYPSPTDIGTPIAAAHTTGTVGGSAFYVWNATQAGGAYQPIIIGNAYSIEGSASYVISANSPGSLAFTEANKTASFPTQLFKTTNAGNYARLNIYDSATNSLYDQLYVALDQTATNNKDNYDAGKLYNTHLDFYSYSADTQRLCVDARPFAPNGIIPLGVATDMQQAYVIRTDIFDIPAGTQLILHDKYLATYTTLGMGVSYPFSITADPLSQGDGRFELGMGGALSVVNVTSGGNSTITMYPNPASGEVTIAYTLEKTAASTVRLINMAGQTVIARNLGQTQTGTEIINLSQIAAGNYLVLFAAGDVIYTQKLVKE